MHGRRSIAASDDEPGAAADAADERERFAIRRPDRRRAAALLVTNPGAATGGYVENPELRVRSSRPVVVLHGVGETTPIGRKRHVADGLQLEQVGALDPLLSTGDLGCDGDQQGNRTHSGCTSSHKIPRGRYSSLEGNTHADWHSRFWLDGWQTRDALRARRTRCRLQLRAQRAKLKRLAREAHRPSLVYCGDHRRAKNVAAKLIRDVGFGPVDAGPLRVARYMEPFSLLVAQLAYEGSGGPEHAYHFRHV